MTVNIYVWRDPKMGIRCRIISAQGKDVKFGRGDIDSIIRTIEEFKDSDYKINPGITWDGVSMPLSNDEKSKLLRRIKEITIK